MKRSHQLVFAALCFTVFSFQIVGCSSREPEVQDESALAHGVNDALEGSDVPAPENEEATTMPPADGPAVKEQSSAPAIPPPPPTPAKAKVSEPPPPVLEAPIPTPPPKGKNELPKKQAKKEKEPVSTGKGFFKTTSVPCPMKAKPMVKAKVLTTVPEGKKLWVEKAGGYYKVFRKKDVGYLASSCFAK